MLIVCCDGLTGFPEAIGATWPDSLVQTCVVHLIRAAMRFVSVRWWVCRCPGPADLWDVALAASSCGCGGV